FGEGTKGRRGGSLESSCKIRWKTSGGWTSNTWVSGVATSGRKVGRGRQPRSDLGLSPNWSSAFPGTAVRIFHTLPEIRRIPHFFPCKQTGGERRVVLGLGGFQEAAPIYRNPVARSQPACARALCWWQGPADGGRRKR